MVQKGQTSLAIWKIDELIKLDSIFGVFEPTYNNRLQSIFLKIDSIVRNFTDNILERI